MDFKEYFRNKNLSKSNNLGIHYEQKTTPDLIWCVSHVIFELVKDDKTRIFSDKEIRLSHLFNDLMQDYFSKPPQNIAENEYNKVSSYQLGLLAYAGILNQVGERPKRYEVSNLEALNFISTNDLNASKFLTEYTEKFLIDNHLITYFEVYKNNPTQASHLAAKDKYWEWAKMNTGVRGKNPQHSYRVFNKIFNVYCYKNKVPGEDGSNITSGPCPYSFLIYNRKNFRDENMPSGMTRKDYIKKLLLEIDNAGVVKAVLLQKAKSDIKRKYLGISEIEETEYGFVPESGVHIHHILPQHSHPEFSLFRENLIALTPGQHLSFAHVQGNTQRVNPDFQKICLTRKFKHVKESLDKGEEFYVLYNFIQVINSALDLKLESTATLAEIETHL